MALELIAPSALDDRPVEYRIPDLLVNQSQLVISGYQSVGKTTLALNLAAAMTGLSFLGSVPCKPVDGTVVFVNLTPGQRVLRRMMCTTGIDLREPGHRGTRPRGDCRYRSIKG
jgi:Mrp family chromosome partitioning ATPase